MAAKTSLASNGLRRWRKARLGPKYYAFIVNHPWVARALARLWGTDVRRLHAEYAKIKDVPDSVAVLDVPCGAGVAFRELPADRRVSYTAVDLSPVMIENARATAAKSGLEQIDFYELGVDDMPFADNSFDLVLTYNGLQHFPDAPGALVEMARVLRPGGELRGSAVIKTGLKSRLLVAYSQKRNRMGHVGTVPDLRKWLADAGFEDVTLEQNGLLFMFTARLRTSARA